MRKDQSQYCIFLPTETWREFRALLARRGISAKKSLENHIRLVVAGKRPPLEGNEEKA